MAAEMPARLEPVEGARAVDFPWEAATSAVSALNNAVSTLDSQLGARPGMVDTLSEWRGSFRDEFDDAHGRMMSTASGLKETLTSLAASIVGGAGSANEEQRQINFRAENPDLAVPV
jgi:uncharacterized protein YukE